MPDSKESRDAAEGFGIKAEEAARAAKEGLDVLRHGAAEKTPEKKPDAGTKVDITVNVTTDE